MAFLLFLFLLGSVLVGAALLLLPYRVRFIRKVDRMAFLVSTGLSGTLGGVMVAASGVLIGTWLLA